MRDAGPESDAEVPDADVAGKGGSSGKGGSGGKGGSPSTSGKGGDGEAGSVAGGGAGGAGMGGAGASGAGDGGKGGTSVAGAGGAAPMSCVSSVPGGKCNLMTSCGCPDDQACYVAEVNGAKATVACSAPGRTNPGSLCNGNTDCVEGHACIGATQKQCRPHCESDKDCGGTKGLCDTVTTTVDNKSVPIEGFRVCFESCTMDSDCPTRCCSPLRSGVKVCAAANYCTCTTDMDCPGGCCAMGSDGRKTCAKGSMCETVEPGEDCASSLVCIGWTAGTSLCVNDDEGSTCHDKCTGNDDCKSGCCAVTKEGTHYCTGQKYCSMPVTCKPAGATCAATAECCGGPTNTSTCVEQGAGPVCQPFCTTNSQCASGCCGALKNGGSVCAPVIYCQ